MPLVLIFLSPVLTKISFGLGPVKLEAATPGVTAKPNMDALLDKLQSGGAGTGRYTYAGSVSQLPSL